MPTSSAEGRRSKRAARQHARFRSAGGPIVLAFASVAAVLLACAGTVVAAGHPQRGARSSVVHDFPTSKVVDVALRVRWHGAARCALVRFPASHVSLVMRGRRLSITGTRGAISARPQTRRIRGRVARLRIRLDVVHRVVRVTVNGRHVGSARGKLIPESQVLIGSPGGCAATRFSSVTVRPSANSPEPNPGAGAATGPASGAKPATGGGRAPGRATPGGASPADSAGSGTPTLFTKDSIWNKPLLPNAALDEQSDLLAGALSNESKRELSTGTGPYVATNSGVPVYTVPRDQPTVPVTLDLWDFGTTLTETLAAGVPLPPTAVSSNNPDLSLVLWQPSTDRMWEFFKLREASDGWHARWGGAMEHVSSNPGYFDATAWPGATVRWGATATSLALVGGLMTLDEVRALSIPHALALSVGSARQGAWAWPAQRSDGYNTRPDAIPEGARFRLDPKLDLSKLDMPPITRAMAVAAQRYGIVVNNQTGQGLCFWAEDATRFGVNYRTDLFNGMYPTQYLRSFPWEHLQLLKMDLRTTIGQ